MPHLVWCRPSKYTNINDIIVRENYTFFLAFSTHHNVFALLHNFILISLLKHPGQTAKTFLHVH